jgi:hypothetical protein
MAKRSRQYVRYLNSESWRQRRNAIRDRRFLSSSEKPDGRRPVSYCERCYKRSSKKHPLFAHHKHYLTLGRERDEDIEFLCESCHKQADRERRACASLKKKLKIKAKEGLRYFRGKKVKKPGKPKGWGWFGR